MTINHFFWKDRYLKQNTGWDIGSASPPITTYFDQINNKDVSILIPGCGNAYEAEYLLNTGFENVYILDFVEEILDQFKKRVPSFPRSNILCNDFFNLNGQFDFIIEQTFFCALSPNLRNDYIDKMKSVLSPSGKLIGVLFNSEFKKEGPPFGGSIEVYKKLFSPHFNIKTLDKCYNSIPPRMDNELFFIFETL